MEIAIRYEKMVNVSVMMVGGCSATDEAPWLYSKTCVILQCRFSFFVFLHCGIQHLVYSDKIFFSQSMLDLAVKVSLNRGQSNSNYLFTFSMKFLIFDIFYSLSLLLLTGIFPECEESAENYTRDWDSGIREMGR